MENDRRTPERKLALVRGATQTDNVAEYARQQGVDRSYLYRLRTEAENAALDLWRGRQPGRPSQTGTEPETGSTDRHAAEKIKYLEREVRRWQIPAQAMALMLEALVEAGLAKRKAFCPRLPAFQELRRKLDELLGRAEMAARWLRDRLDGAARKMLSWLNPSGPRRGRPQLNLTQGELEATAEFIQEHPSMGGKKGSANLIHAGSAWVGASSYDEIKRTIASLYGQELSSRRQSNRPPEPFELPRATGLNQVWGTDLFELPVWGKKFHVCDFIDVYNQEHLAIRAVEGTANSAFAAECFEAACERRGGRPPTVCTKTDRGSQFEGVFSNALAGRTRHVRIPPGTPWFNGESERGHRDIRAMLYSVLSRMKRPEPGKELAAVQRACETVRRILVEEISRPSLGNVTPAEVAEGRAEEVKQANREFVERQRAARKNRPAEPRSLRERLKELLGLERMSTGSLLRFLRLMTRDYKFMTG